MTSSVQSPSSGVESYRKKTSEGQNPQCFVPISPQFAEWLSRRAMEKTDPPFVLSAPPNLFVAIATSHDLCKLLSLYQHTDTSPPKNKEETKSSSLVAQLRRNPTFVHTAQENGCDPSHCNFSIERADGIVLCLLKDHQSIRVHPDTALTRLLLQFFQ